MMMVMMNDDEDDDDDGHDDDNLPGVAPPSRTPIWRLRHEDDFGPWAYSQYGSGPIRAQSPNWARAHFGPGAKWASHVLPQPCLPCGGNMVPRGLQKRGFHFRLQNFAYVKLHSTCIPNALDTMVFWGAGPSWGSVLCAVWQLPCGPLSWTPQDPFECLFWPRAMALMHALGGHFIFLAEKTVLQLYPLFF